MNKVAFELFGIDVRWYGILIATGVMIGLLFAKKNTKYVKLEDEIMEDFLLIALIPSIIGARLYYVLFNLDYYGKDIVKIIDIRSGGLAIHGGLIVGIIISYLFCRKKKISIFDFLDVLASVVPIGQSIGRWGNYINGEAHGGPTDLPWAITVDGVKVHPTFLYESICTFLIFILLNYLIRNRSFKGQIFSLYLILYSLARFFIEGLRTDSLYIGSIRVAQLVSIIFMCIGILIYLYGKKGKINDVLS